MRAAPAPRLRICLPVLLYAAAAAPVSAQAPSRVHVGAGLGIDLLVGDASDFLDGGGSRFLFADFRIGPRDYFHIRLDGSLTSLENDEDQLTGEVAENDFLVLAGGPQVGYPIGRVRPYAGAVVGAAATSWRVERAGAEEDDGSETTFAWGAHAGLGFTLDRGDHPVALRVEARLLDSGTLPFARAPGGLLREDLAVLGVRVAITLGF